jgi:uncharacterized membrane protein AbrB (regulator of aidB expression)
LPPVDPPESNAPRPQAGGRQANGSSARRSVSISRRFLRRAPRFVAAVVISIGAAMALSAVFGVAVAAATGLHPATLVLATTPGGIAEMSITAKVLELGVPLVTAFHVSRVVLLLTCTAPLFTWLRRRRRRAR